MSHLPSVTNIKHLSVREEIRLGLVCPNHNLTPSKATSLIYYCPLCDARSTIDPVTGKPTGMLIDQESGYWQEQATHYYHEIAKRVKTLGILHSWLAVMMQLPEEYCYARMMDIKECKRCIEICTQTLALLR